MRITVVGLGYVGLASAMILSQHNKVIGLDTSIEKINQLKEKNSPIEDADIEEFLHKNTISALFKASSDSIKESTDKSRTMKGSTPGFFGVLHTWGRQIQYHLGCLGEQQTVGL